MVLRQFLAKQKNGWPVWLRVIECNWYMNSGWLWIVLVILLIPFPVDISHTPVRNRWWIVLVINPQGRDQTLWACLCNRKGGWNNTIQTLDARRCCRSYIPHFIFEIWDIKESQENLGSHYVIICYHPSWISWNRIPRHIFQSSVQKPGWLRTGFSVDSSIFPDI
jgi:hypothetical protein